MKNIERRKLDMNKIDNFWVDKNGNRWSIFYKTEEEAIELSKTLINCNDCKNCKNCKECTDCEDCEYCEGCYDCRNCTNCKKSNNCIDCENCENLDGFKFIENKKGKGLK